ncbi:MAG: polyprenyl diphosphate synthase [Gammaproteobacteria bacterium]|nr:polyprenyl diphosphate synthase [Gammaproteobacteria bacterium]
MNTTSLPRHIAIIMDGNGRWAKLRNLPRVMGHRAGVKAVRETIRCCAEKKIEVVTLFAFSSENWQRPQTEVSYLMELFVSALQREAKKLHQQNIQLRIIGDRLRFSEKLQKQMAKAEELTAKNTGLIVVIAANYGGQWDIAQACQTLAKEVEQGVITSDEINASLIQTKLALADLPLPDLFIRTSGEMRISNFMIWQLAYSELYFTECLWPDFNALEFEKALNSYSLRERRYGCTSEQLRTDNA